MGYKWSIANKWDTTRSKQIATDIANIRGLYCGPAVVVWIAAVWNEDKGKPYDYVREANALADGPRFFHGNWGSRKSLNVLLSRATDGQLKLKNKTYFSKSLIYKLLEDYDNPFILRLQAPRFIDGLHYTSIYKARKHEIRWQPDKVKFYWQDNGVYGRRNRGNPGLYGTRYSLIGGVYLFGAKRVVRT